MYNYLLIPDTATFLSQPNCPYTRLDAQNNPTILQSVENKSTNRTEKEKQYGTIYFGTGGDPDTAKGIKYHFQPELYRYFLGALFRRFLYTI